MAATQTRLQNIISNHSLTFIQKIDILIDEFIDRVVEKRCFYKVMLQEQVINKNHEVIKLLKDYKLGYAKLVSTLIAEGQKAKLIKKDVDIVMLLGTMTGTVTQIVINQDYYREFNDYKKLSDTAFQQKLRANLSAHIKHLFKATLGYEQ